MVVEAGTVNRAFAKGGRCPNRQATPLNRAPGLHPSDEPLLLCETSLTPLIGRQPTLSTPQPRNFPPRPAGASLRIWPICSAFSRTARTSPASLPNCLAASPICCGTPLRSILDGIETPSSWRWRCSAVRPRRMPPAMPAARVTTGTAILAAVPRALWSPADWALREAPPFALAERGALELEDFRRAIRRAANSSLTVRRFASGHLRFAVRALAVFPVVVRRAALWAPELDAGDPVPLWVRLRLIPDQFPLCPSPWSQLGRP
jgi:hypothetical protein